MIKAFLPTQYLFLVLFFLLVFGITSFFYRDKLMTLFSKNYQILETRDFSCEGMEGFTFGYPVFKRWEPSLDWQITKENECVLYLSDPTLGAPKVAPESAPQIKITKDQPHIALTENPHGVRYEKLTKDKYFFNLASFSINIELVNANENYEFPKGKFWKQVVESFRFTKEDPADPKLPLTPQLEDYGLKANMEYGNWLVLSVDNT